MRGRKSTVVALVAAAIALGGCGGGSPSGGALPGGITVSSAAAVAPPHLLHYMPVFGAARAVRPDTFLTYSNGPVLVKPKMYLIFWGYKAAGDPNGVAKLLQTYANHVGGSAYDNIYTQYYDIVKNKKTYIANGAKQLGGAWYDDSKIPKQPTDAQIAAEALKGVKHFGYDPNGSFVVATAHGHAGSGFGTAYCAYHSSTTFSGKNVPYTDLPYIPDAGAACGSNFIAPSRDQKGETEGVTIVEGHEYAETITDAKPFSGWSSDSGEIADICGLQDVQNDPFGNKSYASQAEFSDADEACVHHYP